MDLTRPFTSGFWKFTVPATLRLELLPLLSRLAQRGSSTSPTSRRGADAPFPAQIALALRLAGRELASSLGRAVAAVLPESARFPAALLSYLLLVFALEALFLATFMPDRSLPFRLNTQVDAEDAWNPEEVAEARDLVLACLPTSFGLHLDARQLTGNPVQFLGDPNEFFQAEQENTASLEEFGHPLLCLELRSEPPGPDAPYDSVRLAVNRSSLRMPVDHEAVHPLDRSAFQTVATHKTRLSRLFARLDSPHSPVLASVALPASAIAPPMSRLDKIRQAESRRDRLGSLCALFESGVRGIFAIGYDDKGGTSYGKYQISSRKGAMRNFIAYLDKRAPSWANMLRNAGQSNTGGVQGAMPAAWKRIASEQPKLFEKLQDDFIHNYYYSPSLNTVKLRAGLDLDAHPAVVREVLWSTAVQHGPSGGASIFITADSRAKGHPGADYVETLLKEVFRERERRLAKVSQSSLPALKARLRQEMSLALSRLGRAPAKHITLRAENDDRLM